MKTDYSIGNIGSRHPPNQITSKRIQLFQEHGIDLDNARLLLILIKRREIEVKSDGN